MFNSAPSEECVQIDIVDDSNVEQSEEFEVEIDSPQFDGAVSLGSIRRTTVMIVDDGIGQLLAFYMIALIPQCLSHQMPYPVPLFLLLRPTQLWNGTALLRCV